MHLTIGSAPNSWGVWFADDPRQTPWHRFLDEIAEAGYEWMELGPFGYLPTDPKNPEAGTGQARPQGHGLFCRRRFGQSRHIMAEN